MPISIQDLDKNFIIDENIQRDGLIMYSALEQPFEIYGVKMIDGKFRRMDEQTARQTSGGVWGLSTCTAGGRLKFRTDSPYIAIKAVMPSLYRSAHFTMAGSTGFDLYKDGVYFRTYLPPVDSKNGFSSIVDLDGEMHEILIHFPLYSEVSELYVGLEKDCTVTAPTPYTDAPPIVYYGSSITQGGCANRAGMSYQNIISRRLNRDHINLGFSGNAKGEQVMADYIASLEMSAFVLDYDYNAPTPEHLADTHEKFFLTVRNAHPSLPIIIAPRPKFIQDADTVKREKIVRRTYDNAIARGDKNVYYISARELLSLCENEGTVDSTHPTDLGFMSMANAFGTLLEKIL